MHTIRSLFISTLVVALVLGIVPAGVSATATPHQMHLTKDCSTWHGTVPPTYCVIAATDFAAIPVGTKIWYRGPVIANSYFLSSNITLDDQNGNTGTGYCIFETKAPSGGTGVGLCTFWAGTGDLTGFNAIIDVTIDEVGLWHWDGTYYFDEEAGGPPAGFTLTHDGRTML